MIRVPERPEDLPGRQRVAWRREPRRIVLAAVAGGLWPPLVLTLFLWPPRNWLPGRDFDWRLAILIVGMAAVPLGLWLLARERERDGRPSTRLGVVWRFMFYGGLLAAALGAVFALAQVVLQWLSAATLGEGVGGSETSLLIYGVGGLPFAVLIGVAYALWAGLCVAFLAFAPQPEVRDRMGVMERGRRGA